MVFAMSDREVEAVNLSNARLVRDSLQCWIFFVLVYFVCLFFGGRLGDGVSMLVASVPSLKNIKSLSTESAKLAADYFSTGAIFLPFAIVFLGIKQKIHLRLKLGAQRQPTMLKGVLAMYFLVLPFFLIILGFYYWLPIDLSNPRLFGQQVINVMIQSQLGLCLMGSFALMMLAYVILVIGSILAFPFRFLLGNSPEKLI